MPTVREKMQAEADLATAKDSLTIARKRIDVLEAQIQVDDRVMAKRSSKILAMEREIASYDKEKIVTITVPLSGPPVIVLTGPWSQRDFGRLQRPFVQAVRLHGLERKGKPPVKVEAKPKCEPGPKPELTTFEKGLQQANELAGAASVNNN